MRFRKSIRWRIQAWHGVLLLAVVSGFCITAYRLESANLQRHLDQELQSRLGALTVALEGGGAGGRRGERPPPREDGPPGPGEGASFQDEPPGPRDGPPREDGGTARPEASLDHPPPAFSSPEIASLFNASDPEPYYFVVWTRRGSLLFHSPTAPEDVPLPVRAADEHSTRERPGLRESCVFTPPGECLLVGRPLAGLRAELRELAWKLAGIGTAVMVAGLAGGWWIASRALRPIAAISAAANRIAEGHLDERIHTPETESELGRLATLLDSTFQRLDAVFAEQARFTSDAAHELRTPVSIILAQSQLALARPRGEQEYREAIEISRRAAQRMHGLIESLLQLAVMEAGAPLEPEPCDLSRITAETLRLMQALAEEKGSHLEADLKAAPCNGNAVQLAQVVTNLVANAVKFCRPAARIRVSTGSEGGQAFVIVQDEGPGIEPADLPHLFERFYRTDRSRSRASGGAGLGLAICKRIADAHGGSLEVESSPGAGSTFTLRLK